MVPSLRYALALGLALFAVPTLAHADEDASATPEAGSSSAAAGPSDAGEGRVWVPVDILVHAANAIPDSSVVILGCYSENERVQFAITTFSKRVRCELRHQASIYLIPNKDLVPLQNMQSKSDGGVLLEANAKKLLNKGLLCGVTQEEPNVTVASQIEQWTTHYKVEYIAPSDAGKPADCTITKAGKSVAATPDSIHPKPKAAASATASAGVVVDAGSSAAPTDSGGCGKCNTSPGTPAGALLGAGTSLAALALAFVRRRRR